MTPGKDLKAAVPLQVGSVEVNRKENSCHNRFQTLHRGHAAGALSFLSLFTSLGTLLCCALPSLLVLFGLGATVATVLSEVPWLVSLSHHKHWVFIVAGLLIAGNFIYVYGVSETENEKWRL